MSNASEGRKKTTQEKKSVPQDIFAKVELDIDGVGRDITEVSGWIRQARARYGAIQDKLANPSTKEERRRYENALAAAERELERLGRQFHDLQEIRRSLEETCRILLQPSGT